METTVIAGRIEKLAAAMAEAGVDAFLANDSVTMSYLHGFGEDSHERYLTLAISPAGKVALIAPALSASQARRVGIDDIRPWADGEDPMALFAQLADEWNLRTGIVAVEPTFHARHILNMQAAMPAVLFRDGEEILSDVMRVKDAQELDLMRQAAKIADDAYVAALPQIRAGMTEKMVEAILRLEMKARGGKPTFAIVATGPGSAEPHHLSDDTVIKPGNILLMDFGCEVEGYQSDITRTVAVGSATDRMREMYDVVYRAHMAGRAAIRPGVAACDIDDAARKVIEDAGCGEAFFHRLGHGIGMRGHESPYISSANTAPLEAGNCFSIEPGVYFAGEFGIRIENIVVATENGHESLNVDPAAELAVI